MSSLDEWIKEMPRALMVPAAVAAYVTYPGAIQPPRGFRLLNAAGQPVMLTDFPVSYDGFRLLNAAGQPLMLTDLTASYAWFRLLNTVTFCTSLILMLLLSSQRFYSTPARMAALRLVALFDWLCLICVFGSSPEDPFRGFATLLPGVVIGAIVYSGVAIAEWYTRATRMPR